MPYEETERDRITLDPIVLSVWPKVHALDAATARFDQLNREQIRAQHELAALEDVKVFNAIHYASLSATDRNPLTQGSNGLQRGKLATMFSYVEAYDAPIANVLMHAAQLRDIRNWTSEEFDPVTLRELTKTGYMGDIWGAQIRISKKQTVGTVNVLADPQFLGVISVRVDLSVMDAPDPQNLYYGCEQSAPSSAKMIEQLAICGNNRVYNATRSGKNALLRSIRREVQVTPQRLHADHSRVRVDDIVRTDQRWSGAQAHSLNQANLLGCSLKRSVLLNSLPSAARKGSSLVPLKPKPL